MTKQSENEEGVRYLIKRLWGSPHFSLSGRSFWVQYRIVHGLKELLVNEYLLMNVEDPINIAALFRGIPSELSEKEPLKLPYLASDVELSNEDFSLIISRAIDECERRIEESFLSFKDRLKVVWGGAKLYGKTVEKSEVDVALYLLKNAVGDPKNVSLGDEVFIPLSISENAVFDLISGQEDRALSILMKRDAKIKTALLSAL